MSEQAWVKSSYSGSEANCVEVAVRDRVIVRDTKDRTGTVLRFTPAAWRDFAGQVKAGERNLRNGFAMAAGGCGSCLTRGTRRIRSGLNRVMHRLSELNADDERCLGSVSSGKSRMTNAPIAPACAPARSGITWIAYTSALNVPEGMLIYCHHDGSAPPGTSASVTSTSGCRPG